jgi:glycosyltransferase involved in cell wall biosynthesis
VRVLSVVGNLNIGGTESYLARIAPEIREHGIEMEICALEPVGPLLSRLESKGIVVHGTPYGERTRRSNTLTLLRTADAIRGIVRRGRFDLVHTYLFWSDILGVSAARLAGCRRVIEGRRALHAWGHSKSAFFHGLEQTANMLAHELIANSRAALADAEAHERFLPSIRTVIYNGIDVSAYDPGQAQGNGPLRLITVGALSARKGQEYAIGALARLQSRGVDVSLELVGSGPDEAKLRKKAASDGIESRVRFAGEQTDPRPHLACADLFVLPSRQEGFSNALLEAMACALPVVATDVGGNAEALVDGEGGRLVPPQDSEALAAAIAEMASDRERLVAMGRFNRRRVEERFSLQTSVQALADWYRNGPR